MRFLFILVMGLFALISFASLLSPLYWAFDLINHFRPQIMLISVLFFVLALCFWRRLLLPLLFVTAGNAVLLVHPMIQLIGHETIADQNARGLRLLVANVQSRNTQHQLLLDLVRQTKPDLVLLSETNQRWIDAFAALRAAYPHSLLHPRDDNFGLAIYAREPFDGSIVSSAEASVPMAIARIAGITIVNAHPLPPVSADAHRANKAYIHQAVEALSQTTGPAILAGDLNTTLWGDAMVPVVDAGFLTANSAGLGYTWPAFLPVFAMQIDHILTKDISVTHFQVLGSIGSDHFPVLAEIALP